MEPNPYEAPREDGGGEVQRRQPISCVSVGCIIAAIPMLLIIAFLASPVGIEQLWVFGITLAVTVGAIWFIRSLNKT